MMAALLANPEAPLELVVAVVRVTARAGVRMIRWRRRLVDGRSATSTRRDAHAHSYPYTDSYSYSYTHSYP